MQLIEIKDYSDITSVIRAIDYSATQAVKAGLTFYITTSTDKKATPAQRGSLHVWCDQVAAVLNDAGLPMEKKALFSDDMIEVDWNLYLVKEHIYKPMLKVLTGKASTEKQTTVDPSKVAEHLVRHFSSKGVVLPRWPSNK
jgi:hypothetical protein